jgi:uncharacterized membrane protein
VTILEDRCGEQAGTFEADDGPGETLVRAYTTIATIVARIGLAGSGTFALYVAGLLSSLPYPRQHLHYQLLVFGLFGVAFGTLAMCLKSKLSLSLASRVALIAVLSSMLLSYYINIESNHDYSADIMVVSHTAADLVLHGHNPYAVNDRLFLIDQMEKFGMTPLLITREANGEIVDKLVVYPAGHILAFIPPLALGMGDARWTLAFYSIAIVAILWFFAPPVIRPLIALPLLADPAHILIYAIGGVTDDVWVAPVMLSALLLHGRRLPLAALFLGLALATKQQPWLLLPFLAIWLWNESGATTTKARLQELARFFAITALVFVVINAPFFVWDPRAWLSSLAYLATATLKIDGSGLSVLSQAGFVGWSRGVYTLWSAAAVLVLLAAYLKAYATLKNTFWIYPAIILWFNYRSLPSYFDVWLPILLIVVLSSPALANLRAGGLSSTRLNTSGGEP